MSSLPVPRSLPLPRSSVSRKLVMAATGLWLCLFLAVHMAGNMTLFLPEEHARGVFNGYTAFMTGNPVVRLISYLNYAVILVHTAVAVQLTLRNRRARGEPYACDRPGETSSWFARNMGLLGALVLVFLVIHLRVFWYRYHFGEVGVDADGLRDMYGVVVAAFQQGWYVALYVAAMAALAFHLLHGVPSSCRTIGVHHRRYWQLVLRLGGVFAVAIAVVFAAMPVYLYLKGS